MLQRTRALAGACVALTVAGVALVATPTSAVAATPRYTVSAVVYADANSNGKVDKGEGLKGAKVTFYRSTDDKAYSAVSGAGGKIITRLPKATYLIAGSGSGWQVVFRSITVKHFTPLKLRAVRPLGKVLTPTIAFTAHRYAPGDTAHMTVTLTNTGGKVLRGITAACDRAGDPSELQDGSGWGALATSGVILSPHTTRTFHVTNTVPTAAQRAGAVGISCDFGYAGVDVGYRPNAHDVAKVPGAFGNASVSVYYMTSGKMHPLSRAKVVLVDPTSCPVVQRSATTGSTGIARLTHLPAGPGYEMYIYPPAGWKVKYGNPSHTMIFGKDTVRDLVEVTKGTAHVPSPPTRCG